MDIGDFTLTRHAISRALDMGIDGEEIRDCLLQPDHIVPSHTYPGGRNYRRGRLTCSVVDSRVVTIVWSSDEGWRADLVGIGPYAGRRFRG